VDWIEKDIAIGNFQEAKDTEILQGAKIASALSLDGTQTLQPPTLRARD
jgi:hypothetical protein